MARLGSHIEAGDYWSAVRLDLIVEVAQFRGEGSTGIAYENCAQSDYGSPQ